MTLAGLDRQTAKSGSFEVVIIDDGSTDSTRQVLRQFRPSFLVKLILLPENHGRSYARNRGIEVAEGDICLFCDGDTIPAPDFVERHQRHQELYEGTVVSGINNNAAVFSLLYRSFNQEKIVEILKKCGTEQRLSRRVAAIYGENWKPVQIRDRLGQDCLPLLEAGDLYDSPMDTLTEWNTSVETFTKAAVRCYGPWLEGWHTPWVVSVTRNISVSRSAFKEAGMFEERFQGWGSEDWEMGFRLYKLGFSFFCADDVWTFHQEHPEAAERHRSNMQNYRIFSDKHRELEIQLLSATSHHPFWSIDLWAKVVTQYYYLLAFHRDAIELTRAFRELAADLRDHVVASDEGLNSYSWLQRSIPWDKDRRSRIRQIYDLMSLKRLSAMEVPFSRGCTDLFSSNNAFLDAFNELAGSALAEQGGEK